MLDGRVLEASQVEYKPFGKPPLQREPQVIHRDSKSRRDCEHGRRTLIGVGRHATYSMQASWLM